MQKLFYEVAKSNFYESHWHVEAIDEEGAAYVSVFYGRDAQARAEEYADWKNGERPRRASNVIPFPKQN